MGDTRARSREREREMERKTGGEAATTTAGFNFNARRKTRRRSRRWWRRWSAGVCTLLRIVLVAAVVPRCDSHTWGARAGGALCHSLFLSLCLCLSPSLILSTPFLGKALGICVRDRVARPFRVFTSLSKEGAKYASTLVHVHARVTRVYNTYVYVYVCACARARVNARYHSRGPTNASGFASQTSVTWSVSRSSRHPSSRSVRAVYISLRICEIYRFPSRPRV